MNERDKETLRNYAKQIIMSGGIYLEPMGSHETNPFPNQETSHRICYSCNATTPAGQRCEYCGRPDNGRVKNQHSGEIPEIPDMPEASLTKVYG